MWLDRPGSLRRPCTRADTVAKIRDSNAPSLCCTYGGIRRTATENGEAHTGNENGRFGPMTAMAVSSWKVDLIVVSHLTFRESNVH